MIKNLQRKILGAALIAGSLSVATTALASPGMEKGGWGGDHHGMHAMAESKGKKDWSAGSPMGMQSGHMTARLRKVWNLDLSASQRKKIRAIQRDLRAKTWEHEDAIENVSDKLFDLYRSDKRDAKAIGKVYGEIFDHRRQIIEAQVEAGNKVEDVLTKEQRASLKKWGPKPKWGSGWSQ